MRTLPALLTALLVTPLLVLPAAPTAGSWSWPVAAPHPVVREFIAPETRYSAGHRGLDIGTESPTVTAPADGVVHFSGVVVDRPVLSIRHSDGALSSYEPVSSPLAAGDGVVRGAEIGILQPGHCSSLCLHFGVRVDGEYVSPLLYLGGMERSVLLPTRVIASAAPGAAAAAAAFSGAGVRERVALFEPLGGDMGVDLRRAEARVPEHLLHGPKIRSPVEQVGRRGVA
ncbi:hypothetical protein HD599_002164 [Conyzicola lurida]|uniref:M23ase beta-sheet core domain-containing protein n=1 Tax=Conyzicola lurida TaxID=1172621 RepID=A0A841AQ00_9MICO|nr:hypothetical protein [Conyzicola lurida]